MPLVLAELQGLARVMMAGERRAQTLQPTALLNEAWLRMMGSENVPFEDRAHFLRIAARAMRHVLVDHARARNSKKRGQGNRAPTLDTDIESDHADLDQVMDIHEALELLANEDKELAQIVELRFFGGLTLEETAGVLNKTVRQVHRSWTFARGWLRRRVEEGGGAGE